MRRRTQPLPSHSLRASDDEKNLALSPEDRKARQAIWGDINLLHRRIVDKKRELNRSLPISRLNHDIMLEIFIQCALASMFPPFSYHARWEKAYGWLSVTRVCHSWREISLSSPDLWSHFLLTNSAPRTREVLARSKQALLSVGSDRETSIFDGKVLDLLVENLHRICVLDVALDQRNPIHSVELPPVAPQLTHFILRYDYRAQQPLSSVLFERCDMPKLSHLELYNVPVTWTSPIFRASLTHLVVSPPQLAVQHGPNVSQLPSLIDVLKCMPLLEHLDLTSFSHILRIPPRETRLVRLGRLRLIKLQGRGTLCAAFLDHVVHPAKAYISLTPILDGNISHHIAALKKAVLGRLDGTKTVEGEQHVVTGAVFKRRSLCDALEIVAWTSEISLEDVEAEGDRFESSKHVFLRVGFSHATPLKKVYQTVPLVHITKLFFDAGTAGPRDWTLISQSLPNVEQLVVHKGLRENWIPEFLSAELPSNTARHAPAFPELKALMLSQIRFRDRSTRPEDTKEVKVWGEMLTARKEAGFTVEQLILHDCTNLLVSDVETLEMVVGKVVWDPKKSEKLRTKPSDLRHFLDDSD